MEGKIRKAGRHLIYETDWQVKEGRKKWEAGPRTTADAEGAKISRVVS
jgi:hypothetical protein